MLDRIKHLIEFKKLTATQFSEEIGIQRSSLSHVLSGRNKPSLDFMLKIKDRFPEVSLNWLLLGEGEMYENIDLGLKTQVRSVESPAISYAAQKEPAHTKRAVDETDGNDKPGELIQRQESFNDASIEEVETIITLFRDGSFKVYRNKN
jgi:transcriptional regulator with XRE-family HTH domain